MNSEEFIRMIDEARNKIVEESKKEKVFIGWQYCKNPNEINDAIENEDENWEGLESAEQIISITFDSNHMKYVVFWRCSE